MSYTLMSRRSNPVATQMPRRVKNTPDFPSDSFGNMYNAFRTRWGQALTNFVAPFSMLFGKTIVGARFYVRRLGSPTGTMFCRAYLDTGDVLKATFGAVNVATIPLGVTPYEFWGAEYTVPTNDISYIVVEYTGGDISNRVEVAFFNGQQFDSTHTRLAYYDAVPAWNVSSGQDVCSVFYYK